MVRGRRGGGLALGLLAMQIFQVGLDRIPPVTLATIFGNVAIFLGLFDVKYPSTSQVCVSAFNVWYREEWKRLLLAGVFHANEWHLYYNMVSFLWKGMSLEKRLGSFYFAYLLSVFTVLVSVVLVGLDMMAAEVLKDPTYLHTCAVGFSGVIFALKVITTHYLPPGVQYIMGIFPVPSRIACWVELVVIQLLVPNASFTGHLAGILVGLLYVKGPLKPIMDVLFRPRPSYTYSHGATGYRNNTAGYTLGHGSGQANNPRYMYGQDDDLDEQRRVQQAMEENYRSAQRTQFSAGASEDEQLQEAIRNSYQSESNHAEIIPIRETIVESDVSEHYDITSDEDEEENDVDNESIQTSSEGDEDKCDETHSGHDEDNEDTNIESDVTAVNGTKNYNNEIDAVVKDVEWKRDETDKLHNAQDEDAEQENEELDAILNQNYKYAQDLDESISYTAMELDMAENISLTPYVSRNQRAAITPLVNGMVKESSDVVSRSSSTQPPSHVDVPVKAIFSGETLEPDMPKQAKPKTRVLRPGKLLTPDDLRRRRLAKLEKEKQAKSPGTNVPKISRLPVRQKSQDSK